MKKIITAGMVGEVLEWYDFSLYGFFAPILAQLFFPDHSAFISILATFGGFAAGYFMRPLGGIFFGHLGDRFGRKKVLSLTLFLMAIPTFCMGFLPTYATIGIAAPIILVLLRMLQGFSCGGEYTGSIVFLYEHALSNKRGLLSSLAIVGAFIGGLLSVIVTGVITTTMSHHIILEWAWRIPFLIGIITAIIGFYVRMKTSDTPIFEDLKSKRQVINFPIKNILKDHKKTVAMIVGINIQCAVLNYIIVMYIPTYLTSVAHISESHIMLLNITLMLIIIVSTPFFGLICDKVGGTKLLTFATFATFLLTIPLYHFFLESKIYLMLVSEIILGLLIAMEMIAAATIMNHISLPQLRYSTISVGQGICDSLFSGTAPFLATLLVSKTNIALSPAYYIIFTSLITFFVLIKLKKANLITTSESISLKTLPA